jgi:hypothetical protein
MNGTTSTVTQNGLPKEPAVYRKLTMAISDGDA